MSEHVCSLILDLHKADNEPVIGGRVWYRKLDEQWEFWCNGNLKPATVDVDTTIQAGEVYAKFNGWPAGIFSIVTGDGCIAAGTLANVDTFCDALRKAKRERAECLLRK